MGTVGHMITLKLPADGYGVVRFDAHNVEMVRCGDTWLVSWDLFTPDGVIECSVVVAGRD